MRAFLFSTAFVLASFAQSTALAEDKKPEPPAPSDIVAKAAVSDWQTLADEDLMVMTLDGGKTVVIWLAPWFAPEHISNIKIMTRNGFFNNSKILRVQDNYVTQWGRPDEDPIKPQNIKTGLPDEYDISTKTLKIKAFPYKDSYTPRAGYANHWPVVGAQKQVWLPHCYGMVAIGRDMPPDNGTGESLYAVIGHAPRHLDRNLTVVGRVVAGMENLSAWPRGTGALGFYENPEQRPTIVSVALASDLPESVRPHFKVLRTDTLTFDQWVKARANRVGGFFVTPMNGVDICNAMPPVAPL